MTVLTSKRHRKLGVVGGLGPLASAHFYQLLTRLTAAGCDQDHLEILLLSVPQTPDRTRYIQDSRQENPVPVIADAIQRLIHAGADILAIPCVTAHCFYPDLSRCCQQPLLHMIEETAACLERHNLKSVGLLATDGTLCCGIFQQALVSRGIDLYLPEQQQQQRLMAMIYDQIKAGQSVHAQTLAQLAESLTRRGAQAIVLGCTELSLIDRSGNDTSADSIRIYDALEILAASAVRACGAPLTDRGRLLLKID